MFKKIATTFSLATILLVPTFASAASYEVQKGDTLWKIAVKNEVGVTELVSLNPTLENPDLIYPGQQLVIAENEQATVEEEVVRLVNVERANASLAPLEIDWELARVAKAKSQDMVDKNYFSHTSPTYGSPFDMMKQFGIKYSAAGENIAKGQTSAAQVVEAWMNSEGHRANIMSSDYTHIGVGYVAQGHHWTQMFMKK